MVTGVLQGFQTVQGTAYNGNNLEHTPQNATLQGATSVADLLVLKYLNANDGDETWVQVKAGKEVYIYPMTVIRPDKRSVGAKEQRDDDPQAGASPSPGPGNPAAISVNQLIELERKLGVQAQPQQQPSDQPGYDQTNARIHY